MWLTAGALAAVVAVLAGVAAVASMLRPGETASGSLGPLKADAARECRDAISAEGRLRVEAASRGGSGLVTSTVSDVTVTEPRWGVIPYAWVVDGTIKFSIASMIGVLPASVDVRCTATRSSGGQVVTSVANR